MCNYTKEARRWAKIAPGKRGSVEEVLREDQLKEEARHLTAIQATLANLLPKEIMMSFFLSYTNGCFLKFRDPACKPFRADLLFYYDEDGYERSHYGPLVKDLTLTLSGSNFINLETSSFEFDAYRVGVSETIAQQIADKVIETHKTINAKYQKQVETDQIVVDLAQQAASILEAHGFDTKVSNRNRSTDTRQLNVQKYNEDNSLSQIITFNVMMYGGGTPLFINTTGYTKEGITVRANLGNIVQVVEAVYHLNQAMHR